MERLTLSELKEVAKNTEGVLEGLDLEKIFKHVKVKSGKTGERAYHTKRRIECSCGHHWEDYILRGKIRCPKCESIDEDSIEVVKVIKGENYTVIAIQKVFATYNDKLQFKVRDCSTVAYSGDLAIVSGVYSNSFSTKHLQNIESIEQIEGKIARCYGNREDALKEVIVAKEIIQEKIRKNKEKTSRIDLRIQERKELLAKISAEGIDDFELVIKDGDEFKLVTKKTSTKVNPIFKNQGDDFPSHVELPDGTRKTAKTHDKSCRVHFFKDMDGNLGALIVRFTASVNRDDMKTIEVDSTLEGCIGYSKKYNLAICSIDEDYEYLSNRDEKILIDKKEAIEVMRTTKQWSYALETAFNDSFGDDNFTASEIERFVELTELFRTNPAAEILLKAGYKNLVNRMLSNFIFLPTTLVNNNGRNVKEIFGINDKRILRYIRDEDCYFSAISALKELIDIDKNAGMRSSFEDIIYIKDNIPLGVFYKVKQILEHVKGLSALAKYLKSCWDEQRIDAYDALGVYFDYLEMANSVGYDLTNKSILYPDSLKKEHDIVMYLHSQLKKQHEVEEFKKSVEGYNNLAFESEKEGYIVLVPDAPESLIKEGSKLGHCVGNYVDRVRSRQTKILLLRKKERPDKPFYTIEVSGDFIVQVRGQGNRLPIESVSNFLNVWSKEKGLNTIRF